MTSPLIFWPCLAGLVFFVVGLISVRNELSFQLDRLPIFGRVFEATALATFGAEHLVATKSIMQVVPVWMPGRLFWVYFVGFCLLAAAASIVLNRYSRWCGWLLGLMFFLFVLMIHVPNVAVHSGDRIFWAIALRDLAFAAGAWALAGNPRLTTVSRVILAVVLLIFGVEHLLHPEFAPGVPLAKLTPPWVPFGPFWGYFSGAALIAAGTTFLVNGRTRLAGTLLGAWIGILVLCLYLPILATAAPAGLNEAMNYVADTLLFGGTIWLVAAAV